MLRSDRLYKFLIHGSLTPHPCDMFLNIWEEREFWVTSKLLYSSCDPFSKSHWEYRGYEYFRNSFNSKSTFLWMSLIWSIDHQRVWATSELLYTAVCLFNQLQMVSRSMSSMNILSTIFWWPALKWSLWTRMGWKFFESINNQILCIPISLCYWDFAETSCISTSVTQWKHIEYFCILETKS